MSFFINLFAPKKYAEMLSACQEWLNGKKTYIAGSIALLQGLLLVIGQLCALHGIGDLYTWLQSISTNQGILEISGAMALFGIGHKLDKNTDAAAIIVQTAEAHSIPVQK